MTDAKYYRENSSPQYRLAKETLNLINLRGDEHILDIGCGDGRVSAQIAQQVPQGRMIGVDPSNSMIEYAKKHFPQLEFVLGSAETFSFDQKFDYAISFSAVHWFHKPKAAFVNIARHLVPGGEFLLVTYPKESSYWNFFAQTESDLQWKPYLHTSALNTILTSNEYMTLLEECGFQIQVKKVEEKTASYASREEFRAYIKGFVACHITLPEALYDTYLDQIAEKPQSTDKIPYIQLTLKCSYQ